MERNGYLIDSGNVVEAQVSFNDKGLRVYASGRSHTFTPETHKLAMSLDSPYTHELVFLDRDTKLRNRVGFSSLQRRKKIRIFSWTVRIIFLLFCIFGIAALRTYFPDYESATVPIILGGALITRTLLRRYATGLHSVGEIAQLSLFAEKVITDFSTAEAYDTTYKSSTEKWVIRGVYVYIVAPLTWVMGLLGSIGWVSLFTSYDMDLEADRIFLFGCMSLVVGIPLAAYLLWTGWNIFRDQQYMPLTKISIEMALPFLPVISGLFLISAMPFVL